ncbi:DNA-binding XRE family transcriptional regulator [Anaerobacterium chartisolvens]|uniref:DNA-binding XRE family transcriptional regulator n=1 Tax=Anaerobacterium chartisolvens TaxID=1297424 RepID=A0A369BCT7_9FIRM|nr:helix-turn-helix transcriptional regulator [Anaerobacterium chartisolvens]RCX18418.1 DNA-binding XRE family transcriptional regulator [Anaerobacterium chartisolvens]
MDKSQYKEMSSRIKKRRKELGFTQEQVCEMLGISYSSYSKIENAFQKPSLGTIVKISLLMKISIDYLVFGNAEDKGKAESDISYMALSVLAGCDIDKLEYTNEMLGKLVKIFKGIKSNN